MTSVETLSQSTASGTRWAALVFEGNSLAKITARLLTVVTGCFGRLRRFFGVAVLLNWAVAAIWSSAAAQTISSDFSGIRSPSNGIELLQNIKEILDGRILLNKQFYTEDALRRFFGGEKVEWATVNSEPNKVGGYVYDFVAPSLRTEPHVPGLNDDLVVRFDMSVESDGQASAVLVLSLRDKHPRPAFADVEAIFGKDWISDGTLSPLSSPNYRSPVAPHGNEQVIYRSEQSGTSAELLFEFAFDAHTKYIRISMRGSIR